MTKSDSYSGVFCAYSNDAGILHASASGGAFSELARMILSAGGVVYGAGWNLKECRVEHMGIDSWDRIDILQGSKYVRSRLGDVYAKAKSHLEQGRQVLFSGTPCQINGFARFLEHSYDNLVLVDVICHGTPHPDVFEMYRAELERKLGGKIISFSFRQKKDSWMHGRLVARTEKGVLDIPYGDSPYIKAFGSGLSLCDDCFSCKAKGANRFSDITIGDFWGVDRIHPELFDDKGISLVIVHTPKGAAALRQITDNLTMRQVDLSSALKFNKAYDEPTKRPRGRVRFMREFKTTDIAALVERCLYGPKWYRVCIDFLKIIKHKVVGAFQ